jgi:hypothetical protein
MKYEAVVIMDVTGHNGKTKINSVELEYDHALPADDGMDKSGNYTEKGINAMMFAFATGVTSIIHNAGQINGMDTAALFRKAISIMELQFAEVVHIEKTQK